MKKCSYKLFRNSSPCARTSSTYVDCLRVHVLVGLEKNGKIGFVSMREILMVQVVISSQVSHSWGNFAQVLAGYIDKAPVVC